MSFKHFKLMSLIIFLGLTSSSVSSMELRRRVVRADDNLAQDHTVALRVLEFRPLLQQTFGDILLDGIRDPELCMTCIGVGCLVICVPIIAKITRDAHLKQD